MENLTQYLDDFVSLDNFIKGAEKIVKLQMNNPEQIALELTKTMAVLSAKLIYDAYKQVIKYHQEHAHEYNQEQCERANKQLDSWKESIANSDILPEDKKNELLNDIEYAQSAIRNRELDLNDPTRIAAREKIKESFGEGYIDEATLDALAVLTAVDRDGNGIPDFIDCIIEAELEFKTQSDSYLTDKLLAEDALTQAQINGADAKTLNSLSASLKEKVQAFDEFNANGTNIRNKFLQKAFKKYLNINALNLEAINVAKKGLDIAFDNQEKEFDMR